MRRLSTFCLLLTLSLAMQAQQWPEAKPEARAGLRWWWLGSAVNENDLRWNLQQYSRAGAGAVEITPIYGVQGNDANNIPFLSDRYMEVLRFVMSEAQRDSIEVDMATGTGWPFGGPWVPLEESACRAVFVEKAFTGNSITHLDILPNEKDRKNSVLQKVMLYGGDAVAIDVTDCAHEGLLTWKASKEQQALLGDEASQKTAIALYIKYGIMRVKRAAPGGEGLVVDHFDRQAVANYLRHISDAFDRTHTPYPHTFFNDSYEVADGDWTPRLLEEFQKRRGYRLENHLPELLHPAALSPLSDYRETLAELLLENFTEQWTAWAHSHGAITRNQAHGSPANLIDCYAAVDIPEIEGFGLSDFGIKGLRRDPGMTRKNDSDLSMLKYASSAAHVTGKPFTSSETFTWLTEHFRTSLSQMKPDLDLMFCSGVNHMFFHGACYTPKDDPWPGWKFYASVDMSPTNSIWRDAPFLMKYIERCQSFLQMGQPDNDFLVFLPVRDMWAERGARPVDGDKWPTGQPMRHDLLMQFSIHNMAKRAPEFIKSVLKIDSLGYDCDYISERLLQDVVLSADGRLVTKAGTRYKALIIPTGTTITPALATILKRLSPLVVYGEDAAEMARHATPERLKTDLGLHMIRRSNKSGHHYFIANLSPNDVDACVPLAVAAGSATWFDPMTGDIRPADMTQGGLCIRLRSGESRILQTHQTLPQPLPGLSPSPSPKGRVALEGSNIPLQQESPHKRVTTPLPDREGLGESLESLESLSVEGFEGWTVSLGSESFRLDSLQTWESLSDSAAVFMGTGTYATTFRLSRKQARQHWLIDLGDVRESARVYINGQFVGCAWAVPFVLDCRNTLRKGKNELRIEVTNLPANRIADLDRRGVKWRKFNEINVVDLNYKRTTYEHWAPVPSGLRTPVRLIPAAD